MLSLHKACGNGALRVLVVNNQKLQNVLLSKTKIKLLSGYYCHLLDTLMRLRLGPYLKNFGCTD